MAQIVTHRVDHLANAAFGAVALAIVVATLHLLGISPAGTSADAAKTAVRPAPTGQIHSPTAASKGPVAREETLVQMPAGRLGISWQVPAVVSRPPPPPPQQAAP